MEFSFDIGQDEMRRVDIIISKLFSAQQFAKNVKTVPYVHLSFYDISFLCSGVREILLKEPILLELRPPLNVFGDIHGQFLDLLQWFNCTGAPDNFSFLFLGDYVDRGKQSIETICLLFAFKLKYQNKMNLLRGNHESAWINRWYGFYTECKKRYGTIKLWKIINEVFDCLPVAAVIDNRIFCCHGGLSPHLDNIEQIKKISRPTEVPQSGLLCDLLWSDPEGGGFEGWGPNDRGVSYVFGADVVHRFLENNSLDLIFRAHQFVDDGYDFFANKTLITIFSAPNYSGVHKNTAAILNVNEDGVLSFKTLKPVLAKSYPCSTCFLNLNAAAKRTMWPIVETGKMKIDHEEPMEVE